MTFFQPKHRTYLVERSISEETAASARLQSVSAEEGARLLGFAKPLRSGGLAIPYLDVNGNVIQYRVRLDNPGNGPKFLTPKNIGVRPYFPPTVEQSVWLDVAQPIVIVEGPFKAVALAGNGIPCIGLGGVNAGGHDTKEKKKGVLRAHPDLLDRVALKDRRVVIIFDAGRHSNHMVALGEATLAAALRNAGANVVVVALPLKSDGSDQGPDDFLATAGRDALVALIDAAVPADPIERLRHIDRSVQIHQWADAYAALLDDLPFMAAVHVSGSGVQDRVRDEFSNHENISSDALDEALKAFRSSLAAKAQKQHSSTSSGNIARKVPNSNDQLMAGAEPTDMGNAERLVIVADGDLRYVQPLQQWLCWNGVRWVNDETGGVVRLAKRTARAISTAAGDIPDERQRKQLLRHGRNTESAGKLRAMITLAESEPGIHIAVDDLDQATWLLNCSNGTLDLSTGELRPHRRDDHLTKLAPVAYDPDAVCPLWDSFLDQIMDGNAELIRFLQRAIGYSLTGVTREQVLFLFYGEGANGKSTFLDVILSMMGDYAQSASFSTFLAKDRDGIPNDIARLVGSRFVSASEVDQGRRLSEVVVKQVTGGDRITARFLRKEFFDFTPQLKLFLSVNHRPEIRGNDHAIWRRIHLVPFAVTIKSEDQDKQLGARLRGEFPGILAWAVRGCLDWQANGLGVPDAVREATQVYRDVMDVLAECFAECFDEDELSIVSFREIFEIYLKWCELNKEIPLNKQAFAARLTERGIKAVAGPHNARLRRGISLKVATPANPWPGNLFNNKAAVIIDADEGDVPF